MAGEPAVQHCAEVPATRSKRLPGLRFTRVRSLSNKDSYREQLACSAVATVRGAHVSLVALLLISCMSQETPNPVAGSDPAQRLIYWQHCLEASFAEARKKTADANAAADMAFRTCEPREWQVEVSALREGVPPDAFARRKSDWKRALVQTGRLS
jgi:hypothetical protein